VDLDAYVRLAKHLALRDEAALVAGLATLPDPPDVAATTLRYHHLTRPIRAWIPEETLRARLPAALAEALVRSRPIGRASIDDLRDGFVEAHRALTAAAIPVLLFKGFYLADRLYGGVEHRPQSDVDLLVRRRDFGRGIRVLRRLGYRVAGGDIHSKDLVRDTVKLDVHRFLRWAPALALDEDRMWSSAIEARAAGVEFRTLSDEYTLVALIVAAFENLGQGMERLKQLFDLWLLVRALDASYDWAGFLARREGENLLAITVNLLAFVLDLFESAGECPNATHALAAHRDRVVLAGRPAALALLAAPRKARENLVWFGRVYPGSLALYLAWFWYGGFPANLWRLGPSWLVSHLRLARELRTP
jgi:hypothetical protein